MPEAPGGLVRTAGADSIRAMTYERADFAPLRDTGYGIGFHWTHETPPRPGGRRLSVDEAVDAFDVPAFVEQAVACGAGHVLFTLTHATHALPCPHPEVDKLIAGRTHRRDLIMEMADGLAAAGIPLMLYYNHGTWQDQDPEWQAAVGSRGADRDRYFDNYCRIVGWLGERYGHKVMAWWFDSGYRFGGEFACPWPRMTAAAKAGHPQRLVTYNSGIANLELYTEHQDYWAGELMLNPEGGQIFTPSGPCNPYGLAWYSFTSWNPVPLWPKWAAWGLDDSTTAHSWPAPDIDLVERHVRGFRDCGGTVTFNLLCYQDGGAIASDLATCRELRRRVCC